MLATTTYFSPFFGICFFSKSTLHTMKTLSDLLLISYAAEKALMDTHRLMNITNQCISEHIASFITLSTTVCEKQVVQSICHYCPFIASLYIYYHQELRCGHKILCDLGNVHDPLNQKKQQLKITFGTLPEAWDTGVHGCFVTAYILKCLMHTCNFPLNQRHSICSRQQCNISSRFYNIYTFQNILSLQPEQLTNKQ